MIEVTLHEHDLRVAILSIDDICVNRTLRRAIFDISIAQTKTSFDRTFTTATANIDAGLRMK